MINFIEHPHTGYALRTQDNAKAAPATLAFAVDFKSDEIILAHKCAYGKPFIEIDLTDYRRLSEKEIQDIADHLLFTASYAINIVGNPMSVLRGKYTQEGINGAVYDVLSRVHAYTTIESVRSGGQSGPEVSALLWADSRNIPSTCLAPKGWMYRGEDGRDILGETAFMRRFANYSMDDLI